MDPLIRKQVEAIHGAGVAAVIVATGGGARALTWLMSVAGASRTLLDLHVPYSSAALAELLGGPPRRAVSEATSRSLADAAYERAVRLGHGGPVIGLGGTSAIATDRVRRGRHRCFVSARTERHVVTYSIEFVRGKRDRDGEDELCSRLLLRALAEACQVPFELSLDLDQREPVKVERSAPRDLVRGLLGGRVSTVTVYADGRMAAGAPDCPGVLAGSFDPLHGGHEALAAAAAGLLGADVCFELSYANVDKRPLREADVRRRAGQFAGKGIVVLTGAPVFHEKARLFPGCTFVVGWDTAERLVQPRYYGSDRPRMLEALSEIRGLGCRFLVAGRVYRGSFRTLDDVRIPAGLAGMFAAIPESAFRSDESSTGLRTAPDRPGG